MQSGSTGHSSGAPCAGRRRDGLRPASAHVGRITARVSLARVSVARVSGWRW